MSSFDLHEHPALSRLTPQEKDIIQVSFDAFSEEIEEIEDGEKVIKRFITTDKLQKAFEEIEASSTIQDIKLLIDDADDNGDGRVDYDEWLNIMSKKFLGEDDDAASVHVFQMLDDNKDGYIPLVEFRSLLMREGQAPLSEQEVDELMMFADTESDGLVNYRSFLMWLSNPDEYRNKAQRARTATGADSLRDRKVVPKPTPVVEEPLRKGAMVDVGEGEPAQVSAEPRGTAAATQEPPSSSGAAPPAAVAGDDAGGDADAAAASGAQSRAERRKADEKAKKKAEADRRAKQREERRAGAQAKAAPGPGDPAEGAGDPS